MHRLAEAQDTLVSWVNCPLTVGVVWIDHVLPFHRSASVSPLPSSPIAVQALAAVHETPLNVPPERGLGVVWTDHEVPFHASASGMGEPDTFW